MELRLDMCQKLIPYIYKTVTLETASHGSLVGNPVQTDIMRSVLTVLLPNGQMDIPLDDILSISCFGMETLRFDNAASAQPAAPAVPTTPAPVPSSPVAPAAPPVAEEPVAAPEPVNPLELAPKKEPQKQLTELLIDGDLSAALALATEPEALQHQGYTEEETAQITAQLRADKLPNGHTPEAIAQRLWRVVGNHAGLAKQYGHTYLNYVRRNSSKNPLEDWKQAVNYYYAGAAQGDAECAAAVGYCCEMDPRGSNLPLALAWYQHAAKAGSAWAMEKVATFYEEGYGCTANRALADACRETLKYMR